MPWHSPGLEEQMLGVEHRHLRIPQRTTLWRSADHLDQSSRTHNSKLTKCYNWESNSCPSKVCGYACLKVLQQKTSGVTRLQQQSQRLEREDGQWKGQALLMPPMLTRSAAHLLFFFIALERHHRKGD